MLPQVGKVFHEELHGELGKGVFSTTTSYDDWDSLIELLAAKMSSLRSLQLLAAPLHCLSDLRRLKTLDTLELSHPGRAGRATAVDASPLNKLSLTQLTVGKYKLAGAFRMPLCKSLSAQLATPVVQHSSSMQQLRSLDLYGGRLEPGCLDLPHLTWLRFQGSHYNALELRCPSLLELIVDYENSSYRRGLSALSSCQQLTCLMLLQLECQVDLQALTGLRQCPNPLCSPKNALPSSTIVYA